MLRCALALAAILTCQACKSTPPPQPPDDRQAEPDALKPVPAEHRRWAGFYGIKTEKARLTKDEEALWRRVLNRTRASCEHDPRLTLAARVHAEDIAQSPSGPVDGDLDLLRFALHRLGSIHHDMDSQVIRMDRVDQELDHKLGHGQNRRWTHCGVGIAGEKESAVGVWIGIHRGIDCDPIPMTVPAQSNLILRCRARNRSQTLIPFLGLPNGAVEPHEPVPALLSGEFRFGLRFLTPGRHDVELLLQTRAGPRVAALFPIFAGVEPDPRPTVTPDITDENDQTRPDQALLDYLNTARKRAGLAPLERDFRLDRAALSHSHEMAELGFFGHNSPRSGSLSTRMEAERLRPSRVAENMARSRTALRIHRNLMSSPSHRINMLDPHFTHVGIGVVQDGPDLIATEIFANWERRGD